MTVDNGQLTINIALSGVRIPLNKPDEIKFNRELTMNNYKLKQFVVSFLLILVFGIVVNLLFHNWAHIKGGSSLSEYTIPTNRIITWVAFSLVIAFVRTRRGV